MKSKGTLVALVAALMLTSPAAAAAAERCPATPGSPTVYAIGSSTLGSVLGPMLQRILKDEGVAMHRWGRASSGLARPDFHDWLALTPGLMAKHRPDIVVISLGTNDFQALYNKGKWVGLESKQWETIYAKRVDKLLAQTGGKNKQRLVVWMGPHAFEGERAEARGPIVNRIMRERVEAYAAAGGNAVFVDAFGPTLGRNGRPLEEARLPGSSKIERIRTPDNIHLTTDGVRWLMAEPILAHIRPCIPSAEPVASSDAPADDAPATDAAAVADDDSGAVAAEEAKAEEAAAEGDAPATAGAEADHAGEASGDAPKDDAPAKAQDEDNGEAPQAEDVPRPAHQDGDGDPQGDRADDAAAQPDDAKPSGDQAKTPKPAPGGDQAETPKPAPSGDQAETAKPAPSGDQAETAKPAPSGDQAETAKPRGDQAETAKPAPSDDRFAKTTPAPPKQAEGATTKPTPPVPAAPPAPAPSRAVPDRDGDAGALRPRSPACAPLRVAEPCAVRAAFARRLIPWAPAA